MTPVKLPDDLIRKPLSRLHELRPGESAWIDWVDMVVNLDHQCFLNPEAKLKEKTLITLRVTCTEAGFEVLIPTPKVSLQWTPGEFSVKKTYFPVIKLERGAPETEA